jgi:hypothetical protein
MQGCGALQIHESREEMTVASLLAWRWHVSTSEHDGSLLWGAMPVDQLGMLPTVERSRGSRQCRVRANSWRLCRIKVVA